MQPVKFYRDRTNNWIFTDAKRYLFDRAETLQMIIDAADLRIGDNPLRVEYVQKLANKMLDGYVSDKYVDTTSGCRSPEQRLVFAIIYQAMNDYADYHPERGRKNGHTRPEVV